MGVKKGKRQAISHNFVFEISLLNGFKSTNNVPTCTPCSYLNLHREVAHHTYRRTVPYLPTHTIILVDAHSHTCRNNLPYMLLTEAEEPIQNYSLQIAIYNTLNITPSFLCGQFKNFHSIP